MNKKTLIYYRVANNNQVSKLKANRQKTKCLEYSIKNGYRTVEFVSEKESGTDDNRPGLKHVFEFIESTKSGNVIVYSTDRLTRNYAKLAEIKDKMADSGVRLISVASHDSNPFVVLADYK